MPAEKLVRDANIKPISPSRKGHCGKKNINTKDIIRTLDQTLTKHCTKGSDVPLLGLLSMKKSAKADAYFMLILPQHLPKKRIFDKVCRRKKSNII